ncbi:uncharacterized protein BO66DRAFT_469074 [Aspergillus aculeatinus CBS 121060]|uniref:Uncharacterized protein n=1 Tax=Aspergillus aculeatinus CBS 121060 TaxID=1448322 RepID=A0ACD1HHI7_9EURO|nr:hypothetical protein BO66DRAFT_469074 [Aspergillus aculeatinus CBS 121060]RAH73314.1 hypothetical protein BO66DRAFT_469074 [Aspergillus aculeatinus CBS 121060]
MGNLTVSELHKALPGGNYLDWLVVDDVLHQILVDAKQLTKPIRHLRVRMQLEDQLIDRLPQLPLFIHSAYDANKFNCMLYLFQYMMKLKGDLQTRCRKRRLVLPANAAAGELGTFTKPPANVISKHFVEINVRRAGKPETRHQSNWRYYYTDDGEGGKVVCRLPQGMYGAFVDEIRDKRVYYRRDKDVLQPLWPEAESMNVAVRGLREKIGDVVEGEEAWLRALFALMHSDTGPVWFVVAARGQNPDGVDGVIYPGHGRCGSERQCMHGTSLGDEASRDQESSPGSPSRSPELDRHSEDDLHSEPEIPPPAPTRGTRHLHAREPHPPTNKPTHDRIFIPPWTIPQIPPPPQPQPTITPALGDRDSPPARPSSSRSILNTPPQPDCAETDRRTRRHLTISSLLN